MDGNNGLEMVNMDVTEENNNNKCLVQRHFCLEDLWLTLLEQQPKSEIVEIL